jgi:enterobacterial common antigen flippase
MPLTIKNKGELFVSSCTCIESEKITDPAPAVLRPLSPEATVEPTANVKATYGQILKSSAWIGGSQAANIALGIVRTKAMALLLGPAGFGLFGLYGSVATLVQSVAGMGINSSGVRQIAEAVGSGDNQRIAHTTAVLKRTSFALGLLGAGLLLVFCRQISVLTFGTPERTGSVALLSLVVFFALIAGAQGALIQGMRRISDLARVNVLGALLGIITSIPLVYFLREKGVVPALVSVAAMTILTFWWYSRKIKVERPRVTFSESWHEASALLKLGAAFMASGLMTTGVAYFIRVIMLHKVGIEATGLYQCAWTLGGLYVGFILQAMGADFYPRLTSVSTNNAECNRLVNEQALVGLLLAGPGVIATLTFAPLVIALFYSAKFGAAVGILRWICLGVTLQVITWPMGFIILAKGKANLFFLAELAWTVVAAALAWVCVMSYGVIGAGIAFFGSYAFHGFLIYPFVRRLSNFRWSVANRRIGVLFLSLISAVFCGFYVLPTLVGILVGVLALVGSGIYSWHVLLNLLPLDRIPRPILRISTALGLISSSSPRSAVPISEVA